MIQLAVFDFDSTLMDGETIDFLADAMGVKEEVARITKEAMEGRLDFFESLTKRVKFLKGLEATKARQICENLPYMPGAFECIQDLKKMGMKVVVFSGGFQFATSYAREKLGYHIDFANELHVKDKMLTGLVGGEMMFSYSKGNMLQRLQAFLSIDRSETMVVGDGANDLSMFAYADTKIAFCAKKILEEEASVKIKTKDLTQILNFIA